MDARAKEGAGKTKKEEKPSGEGKENSIRKKVNEAHRFNTS